MCRCEPKGAAWHSPFGKSLRQRVTAQRDRRSLLLSCPLKLSKNAGPPWKPTPCEAENLSESLSSRFLPRNRNSYCDKSVILRGMQLWASVRADCGGTAGVAPAVVGYRPPAAQKRALPSGFPTRAARSEAAHFRFRLGAAQIVERRLGGLRCAELGAEIALHLADAQHRLGGDIALIRQDGCDDVDRARTLLQDVPGLAIGLHAGEHVIGARRGRIVVELVGNRRRDRHADGRRRAGEQQWDPNYAHRTTSLVRMIDRIDRGAPALKAGIAPFAIGE